MSSINLNNNNIETGSQSNQYTWLGVLEFLQDQVKEQAFKETEWVLEKQQMRDKIGELESEVKAHEKINTDLLKRIKMLEFSLRQERIRYNKLLKNDTSNGHIIDKALEENKDLTNIDQQFPQIPKRKAQNNRPLLTKILEEVGLEDIFKSQEYQQQEKQYEQFSENVEPESVQRAKHEKQQTIIQSQINQLEETSQNIKNMFKEERNSIVQQSNANYQQQQQQQQQQNGQSQGNLKEIANFRAHFDGVRETCFISEDIFVTVSEDCMVRLWDVNSIKNSSSENSAIDPYYTLREHTGPLFTITSCPKDIIGQDNCFFTAGAEGLIKCWNAATSQDSDNLGETEKVKYCIGTWNCHDEEVIWQIVHHPYAQQLLSSSAEGCVKLWSYSNETDENQVQQCIGNFNQQFIFNNNYQQADTPTSIDFVNNNLQQFVSGYVGTNSLGKQVQQLKFQSNQQAGLSQPNRVISHQHQNTIVSGHEDNQIRIFDINSNQMVKQINAHSDGVKSVCFSQNENYLHSVSNDGFLKTWDFRKGECVQEINDIHLKKYDETIHNISISKYHLLISTAGADGDVKIFSYV